MQEWFCAYLENNLIRIPAAFGPTASPPPFWKIIKAPCKGHHKGMCFTSQHRWLVYTIPPSRRKLKGWIQISLLVALCVLSFHSSENWVLSWKYRKKLFCFCSFSCIKTHTYLLPAVYQTGNNSLLSGITPCSAWCQQSDVSNLSRNWSIISLIHKDFRSAFFFKVNYWHDSYMALSFYYNLN